MNPRATMATMLLLAPITACGSDDATALPDCGTAWEVGNTLPDPYDGCDQDGQTITPVWFDCPDGGRYAEWDDGTAYAREGQPVVDTAGELARICD